MDVQRYVATVVEVHRGRVIVPVPFDPDQVFGSKARHHVAGTVNGMGVRAVIEAIDGATRRDAEHRQLHLARAAG